MWGQPRHNPLWRTGSVFCRSSAFSKHTGEVCVSLYSMQSIFLHFKYLAEKKALTSLNWNTRLTEYLYIMHLGLLFLTKSLWIELVSFLNNRLVIVVGRVGYRFFFFGYRCQIDTFKTVLPVPKRCMNRYQLIIGLAISTKHMGPVSQTGLRLNQD